MKLNLKILGLALFAVLATSAMLAQGASAAENHEFVLTEAPAVLTGHSIEGNHVFEVAEAGSGVECKTATFEALQEEKVQDELEVYPTYTECNVKGTEIGATVTNHGCTYVFDSDTEVTVSEEHAPVALECHHDTYRITVVDNFGFCVIDFSDTHPPDEPTINQVLHGVTYENVSSEGTPHEVIVDATVTGITYEATDAGCELLGIPQGTGHDGKYSGKATIKAYENEGTTLHTGDGTQENPPVHDYNHNGVDAGATVVFNTKN